MITFFVLTMLWVVMVIGGVGVLITSTGAPTRRKLRAKRVFYWMLGVPVAVALLMFLMSKAGNRARR